MKKYRLTDNTKTIFRDDGACIPVDSGNRDYREYQRWLDDGNAPDPAPEPSTEPTLEEKVEALLQAAEGKPAKLDEIKAKRSN